LKKTKVIIIGSKGFIGSHLFAYLIEKDYSVYGADVVVDYVTDSYFLIDSTNADFNTIFKSHRFDWCINCSGAASVPASLNNPARDFELNSHNVFRLLSAIKEYSPSCRFLNLSSAAVYGNPDSLPVSETSHCQPVSPYGYHKQYSEMICEEFFRFFNVPTCSLRIFSAYGEGLQKQLFWDLHKKTLSNESIVLFGTGEETRDFIYIKDLVRLIEIVCEKGSFEGDALNAANGQEISIAEAVETFYQFYPKKIDCFFGGNIRQGDPSKWVADITKINEMGFSPQYSLKEGLFHYFQWVQKFSYDGK
jgi:dTDP-glucose 4,6-dehydratase/UDP-glucose 4-epimerase